MKEDMIDIIQTFLLARVKYAPAVDSYTWYLKIHWAIPEIRCTPPKEDMGIPKFLTTLFIGKSKKKKKK